MLMLSLFQRLLRAVEHVIVKASGRFMEYPDSRTPYNSTWACHGDSEIQVQLHFEEIRTNLCIPGSAEK